MVQFPGAQLQRVAIAESQRQATQLWLTDEQHHYLVRVLRLKAGDEFIAIDPQGQWWRAALISPTAASEPEAQILDAIAPDSTELPVSITLIAALPKGSGFDEVVRQVTELGVDQIVPVTSARTLLQPSPQRYARWQRIVQEAVEQSERQRVPSVWEPVALATRLSEWAPEPGKRLSYIGVTRQSAPHLLTALKPVSQTSIQEVVMAIGPEGGWTEEEVAQAIALGYQPVSLGQRILRAVTAPIVALTLVAAAWEAS